MDCQLSARRRAICNVADGLECFSDSIGAGGLPLFLLTRIDLFRRRLFARPVGGSLRSAASDPAQRPLLISLDSAAGQARDRAMVFGMPSRSSTIWARSLKPAGRSSRSPPRVDLGRFAPQGRRPVIFGNADFAPAVAAQVTGKSHEFEAAFALGLPPPGRDRGAWPTPPCRDVPATSL